MDPSYDNKRSSSSNAPNDTRPFPDAPITLDDNNNNQIMYEANENLWSTQLFDCDDDPLNCFITTFFPYVTFGQIAEIVNRGHQPGCALSAAIYFLLMGSMVPCVFAMFNRTNMRRQYGLVGSTNQDCLIHFFCGPCALCQEYRELHNRGYDMYIGWEANRQRGNQGIAMVPPSTGPMMR